ncbi:MAG: ligand-binding sensor domain-containing protein, partial [Aggregatilineales bacterium]
MNKNRQRFLWLAFLLTLLTLWTTVATAQREGVAEIEVEIEENDFPFMSGLRFEHLSAEDGLVQNEINAILQDRNGFIWFGTDNGLSRYDGYTFKNYQTDPDNPNSLRNNKIQRLYEGKAGHIWIATEGGGIHRFDPVTGLFEVFPAPFAAPENGEIQDIPGDRHFFVMEDSQGHIWAGGPRQVGLVDFDQDAGISRVYQSDMVVDDNIFIGTSVRDMIETTPGVYWLAVHQTVSRYELESGRFYNYRDFPGDIQLRNIMQTTAGEIWAGGGQGIYYYNPSEDMFILYEVPSQVNDILEVSEHILWLASDDGLHIFDTQQREIVSHHVKIPGQPDSLTNNEIDVLFKDASGTIWIGSEAGLDVYDDRQARFEYYRQSLFHGDTGTISAFYLTDDEETLWVSMGENLHHVDLRTGEILVHELEDESITEISAITQDHRGILWVGTNDARLIQYDPQSEEAVVFAGLNTTSSRSVETIQGILSAQQRPSQPGQSPPSGQTDQRPPQPGQSSQPDVPAPRTGAPRNGSIIGLYEDDANQLWVLYNLGGIYRLDESRENIISYNAPAAPRPPES